MARRTVFVLVSLFVLFVSVNSASAQRVEASVGVGYSASEGISLDNRPLLGQVYDTLAVDSGATFNLTFGVFATEQAEVEFLFSRQNSRLQGDGPGGKLPISELAVYNYMFNFVYNWGSRDAKVRPYLFGGLGATNYSFGDNLLVGSTGNIGGESRFSTNWGGGVKFYFTPNVGAKVGLRWTPTLIKSDPAGVWCDPFYGCWTLVDNDYSNQFETSGGITFRFEE
jgi:opacity protein-like surface antigen